MESEGKLDEEVAILPLLRWAGVDPEAALTFALNRGEFKDSERVLSALMYQLAKVDVAEAKAALDRIPEKSEERRDAQRAIVRVMLQTHIAQRWWWAKAPPGTVADWATSLPAGVARDAAVGEVGRLWVQQDSMAASQWIDGLPGSPGRDAVVRQLSRAIQQETPGDAFVWAGTIQDPAMRRDLLRESIAGWAAKDSSAALSAVEMLPVEQRGELREIVSKFQSNNK